MLVNGELVVDNGNAPRYSLERPVPKNVTKQAKQSETKGRGSASKANGEAETPVLASRLDIPQIL